MGPVYRPAGLWSSPPCKSELFKVECERAPAFTRALAVLDEKMESELWPSLGATAGSGLSVTSFDPLISSEAIPKGAKVPSGFGRMCLSRHSTALTQTLCL